MRQGSNDASDVPDTFIEAVLSRSSTGFLHDFIEKNGNCLASAPGFLGGLGKYDCVSKRATPETLGI